MNRRKTAIDDAFNVANDAHANRHLDDIIVEDEGEEDNKDDFILPNLPTNGLDWKVILMGELDNRHHEIAKRDAALKSKERRQLQELQLKMHKEAKLKEKAQRSAIRKYLKKKQLLRDFQLGVRREAGKQIRWV